MLRVQLRGGGLKLIPVDFDEQLVPGTSEHAQLLLRRPASWCRCCRPWRCRRISHTGTEHGAR